MMFLLISLGVAITIISLFVTDPLNLDDLAIVVHSFDGYERYWEGWYHFYKKNTPYLSLPCYFLTETKVPNFANAVNVIQTGKCEWSDRLLTGLKQISFKYVLYFQENVWLIDQLSPRYISNALRCFRKQTNLNLVKLHGNCKHQINSSDVNSSSWYIASHQPGIWRKSFLESSLRPNMTPFRHEMYLNYELHKNVDLANTFLCKEQWKIRYNDVSRQGQITQAGLTMLKDEGLTFKVKDNEIMIRDNV